MKLHEIRRKSQSDYGTKTKKVTIWPISDLYGEVDLEVTYTITSGGSSRHGDNASFDEHHPDEVEIEKIILANDAEEYDEDGEKVIKTWKKGFDARELPGWTGKDEDNVEERLFR